MLFKTSNYVFFTMPCGVQMASNKGRLSAMVDTITGDITGTITYGLMGYHEQIESNIRNMVNSFPCTVEDHIILKARTLLAERNC